MADHGLENASHDSDKQYEAGSHAEEIENREVLARPTYGQRVKRHCARRWWIHLIIFCIVFLIIALCLVYVAMPKIAQHGVNESSIQFTYIQFLRPTPDSIFLSQEAILHSPSVYTPTLDPFNASLYLVTAGVFGTAPLMILPMPRIHALHPQSTVDVSQNVTIDSLDQVTQYATEVLTQETVTTALTGRTKLHEGKLPVIWVNYNTTTTYNGLNGLKGFNVTGVKLNLLAKAGEPNLSGFAYVPNPSFLTIEMGNVTLSLSTAQAGVVGNSTINNFTLVPGNNTLPMTGIMNQTAVLDSMDANGYVSLSITGQSSVYNGQHLSYYEAALKSNVLSLSMNVKQILADSV